MKFRSLFVSINFLTSLVTTVSNLSEDTKLNYEIICVRKLCYDFCSVSLHRFVFLAVGIIREKFLDPGQRKISLTRFKDKFNLSQYFYLLRGKMDSGVSLIAYEKKKKKNVLKYKLCRDEFFFIFNYIKLYNI